MNTYSRMANATKDSLYFKKQFANFNVSVLVPADGLNQTFGFWNTTDRLFYRDDRFLGTQVYWGRGNAWALGALVAALEFGKGADAHYVVYLDLFHKLVGRLAATQSTHDGAWRSSLLDPSHYPTGETSATATFTFGIAWGINNGILQRGVYEPVVWRAWQWLSSVAFQRDSGMVGYCQPGGSDPENNFNRSTTTNFCVGMFLLATSEVSRLLAPPA